ncbi:Peptide-O-fucosyltransferase [Zostera marina]|uniref:O-fucosyltransferase family protein n=1 Tax=Zostera marina TaxID=29655 RepID=A0A0K9NJ31_ZOSMR|nr:Peptide-O-fucosyltransferase [Zostera marina]
MVSEIEGLPEWILRSEKMKEFHRSNKKRLGTMWKWILRLGLSVFLYTTFIQWLSMMELWHPKRTNFHRSSCFDLDNTTTLTVFTGQADSSASIATVDTTTPSPLFLLPRRVYQSNGYLQVSCNGGLNQMRAAICDMVTIARYLNLTLILPELDKTSFWADTSDFADIFDADHFINSLRDQVRILKAVPRKFNRKIYETTFSMAPVSWSNENYYKKKILPLFRKHKVIHFKKTDARLANNNLPIEFQMLRCRVNFEALKFTSEIEALGKKLVSILQRRGSFVVLHLRYEMDMLAFSGCTHSCSNEEAEELTRMRYAYPWWKEKEIDSEAKRANGLCPFTPEETSLILEALGFTRDGQIYIASGEIYGGEKRLASLRSAYPNIVHKEMLLSSKELDPLLNHSTQMAALDYLVSVASDVFIPSYDGNMARVVEGHRRYSGYRKTINLNRKKVVRLLDQFNNKTISWAEFGYAIKTVHMHSMGRPKKRKVVVNKPKEEDYFYSNPHECIGG